MKVRGKKFRIDRQEGKFLGVSAGIANYTGIDATIVRIAFVVATLVGGWPWTVIAYFAAAWFGRENRVSDHRWGQGRITAEERERTRDLDLRLQAIETYTSSANSRLAREIEELR